MGWWWQSNGASATSSSTPSTTPDSQPSFIPEPEEHSNAVTSPQTPHDELKSIWAEIEASSKIPAPRRRDAQPTKQSTPDPITTDSQPTYDNEDDAHLFPSSMSCRNTFDLAFHCQTIGGQFINNYRYGGLRNCSPLWQQFWWCMRNVRASRADDEGKARVIRDWYREDEYKKYHSKGQKSSEDIWTARGPDERVEKAFHLDLREVEAAGAGRE